MPAERLRVESLRVSGGANRASWNSRPSRVYRLETTNRLGSAKGTWANATAGLVTPGAGSSTTQTVASVTAPTRCYRVKAVVPLTP